MTHLPDNQHSLHLFLRVSLSEKFANYYGNLRGLLLGSNLAGRRAANYQENLFADDAQLTAFKKDGKDKESKTFLSHAFILHVCIAPRTIKRF